VIVFEDILVLTVPTKHQRKERTRREKEGCKKKNWLREREKAQKTEDQEK
jgi:hypothetical protein